MAGGKTYQVTQVDPFNPHTKGMVYQVNIVGGGTQMEELPEASADNVGLVYQYLGESDANFTHGYFYESKAQGTNPETYAWEAIDTQAGGAISTANTDLSNLSSTGANIANWSSSVSNCITNIPQDVNLTLSNGTLTLKSGSKCYLKTDSTTPSVNVTSDLTTTQSTNGTYFAIYDGSDLTSILTTAYDYSTLPSTYSLPLALITVSGGTISKIDQVFNGFGYIGSTVFALPGVKGLIPNGRNADGALKSSSFTINNVLTTTDTSGATGALEYYINGSGIFRANLGTNTYKEEQNIIVNPAGVQQMVVALDMNAYRTSGKVSSLKPKTTFRAVDYNNCDYIANCSMPSNRYIDLTLPTSGQSITAPADGYFTIAKGATTSGQYVYVRGTSNNEISSLTSASDSLVCRTFLPVFKGQAITITYTADSTTYIFRFVYANGAK